MVVNLALFRKIDANAAVLVRVRPVGQGKDCNHTAKANCSHQVQPLPMFLVFPSHTRSLSVAKRVAEESGCRLGEEVGYTIRFEDLTTPQVICLWGFVSSFCLVPLVYYYR